MRMDNETKLAILDSVDNYQDQVGSSLNQFDLGDKHYRGNANFTQPYIAACGYITSAGATDTSRFLLPSNLNVSKTATGVYKITHNIGSVQGIQPYLITAHANNTTAIITNIANVNSDTVEVRTFDAAGAAIDSAFLFTISVF